MNRKCLTTYVLLAAFIGLAVFGFAAMGTHDGMDGQVNCIASIGQAALCSHQNTLTMAILHSSFFQSLTSAIILLTLLALVWVSFKNIPTVKEPIFKRTVIRRADLVFAKSYQPILRWLNLHAQIA